MRGKTRARDKRACSGTTNKKNQRDTYSVKHTIEARIRPLEDYNKREYNVFVLSLFCVYF